MDLDHLEAPNQNKQMEPSIEQKSDGDKYHGCKSDISSRYLQQMEVQEISPINFPMKAFDHTTTLCSGGSSNILPNGPSEGHLLSLPADERLKKILIEGPRLHCFCSIKHFAPEYSEEELLGFLQQHARLVCGVWAPKSASLCPHGGVQTLVTSLGGVPPRRMTMSNETQHALPIVLKKLFQIRKVCSFQMICQGLREMAACEPILPTSFSKIVVDAAHSLDGPLDELKAVISEVACDIHGYYVLKSSQDDPFRDVVIDMLRGSGPNAKLKKAEILEAARRKLNREVTNTEYTKVMGELCVPRSSVWIFKSVMEVCHDLTCCWSS